MEKKRIIAALALALVGACLIKLHVDRAVEEAWGGPPETVLALTTDLEAGATLEASHMVGTPLPARYVESRHVPVHEQKNLLGLRVTGDLRAGELLLLTDVVGMQGKSRKLSTLLSNGLRAMPVNVANAGFARLVQPGDRVDVLLSSAAGDRMRTETLLENLLVLAVGTTVFEHGATRGSVGGRVTLGVTPAQSHLLASAERGGQLRITLRGPSDHVTGEDHAG